MTVGLIYFIFFHTENIFTNLFGAQQAISDGQCIIIKMRRKVTINLIIQSDTPDRCGELVLEIESFIKKEKTVQEENLAR